MNFIVKIKNGKGTSAEKYYKEIENGSIISETFKNPGSINVTGGYLIVNANSETEAINKATEELLRHLLSYS